jgi:hypothetical protein
MWQKPPVEADQGSRTRGHMAMSYTIATAVVGRPVYEMRAGTQIRRLLPVSYDPTYAPWRSRHADCFFPQQLRGTAGVWLPAQSRYIHGTMTMIMMKVTHQWVRITTAA